MLDQGIDVLDGGRCAARGKGALRGFGEFLPH